VLSTDELAKIRYIEESEHALAFTTVVVDGLFDAQGSASAAERLAAAIEDVCDEVVENVRAGPTS